MTDSLPQCGGFFKGLRFYYVRFLAAHALHACLALVLLVYLGSLRRASTLFNFLLSDIFS